MPLSTIKLYIGVIGALLCFVNHADGSRFTVTPNVLQQIEIPANETSTITVTSLSEDANFLVVQVFAQWQQLLLSSNQGFTYNATKNGTSIGLVTLLTLGQSRVVWYVRPDGVQNVSAAVVVQEYTSDYPIPGACNQVFNVAIDPSIQLETIVPYSTRVWFQEANLAVPIGQALLDCESTQVLSSLTYQVYVSFMQQNNYGESEFFDAIQNHLWASNLTYPSHNVFTMMDSDSSVTDVTLSSKAGQGVIYSVVVTRSDTGLSATYITVATYNCDMDLGTCPTDLSVLQIFEIIIFIVVGLFLLFFGHTYFSASQVLFGFIFAAVLTYIGTYQANLEEWLQAFLIVAAGLVLGMFWLVVWLHYKFPIAQVFLMGLCTGYVISAIVFFSPFGNIDWWTLVVNYCFGFICISLFVTVSLLNFPNTSSIISCSVLGSLLIVWAIAIPLWGSVEMIMLNAIYHQTVSGYLDVMVVYPVNTSDLVLYVLWPLLACIGVVFQKYWSRSRHQLRPMFGNPDHTQAAHRARIIAEDEEYENEEEYSISNEERNLIGSRRRSQVPQQVAGSGVRETSSLLVPAPAPVAPRNVERARDVSLNINRERTSSKELGMLIG